MILDKELYSSLVKSMLNEKKDISEIIVGSYCTLKKSLELTLQEGVGLGLLTQKEFDYLSIKYSIIPIIHSLPKTHKERFPQPPRPIISGVGSLCERLSEWVDAYL